MAAARAMFSQSRSSLSRVVSTLITPVLPLRLHTRGFSSSIPGASTASPVTPLQVAEEGGSILSIDRSGLVPRAEESHNHIGTGEQSAMSKHISALIKFRGGPISVAEYMGEVLTNPNSGYYMYRDVFGAGGDFVTSPDSSQMFGEMLGVWSMLLWEQMGKPNVFALIELGPGRGTLMADLIRSTSKFQEFSRALRIHFVECSPTLRKMQEAALNFASMPISWHMELDQVPRGVPCTVIAHEFYDALPIHQFQNTTRGWCEKLVDVGKSHHEFRFVLSPKPTTASTLHLERRLCWASEDEKSHLEHVEVCPQAWKLTEDIAQRVAQDGGGALIIDYGEDKVVTDSLQAIKKHEFVDVLKEPGSADLSAYVDFSAIKCVVKDIGGVSAYGPVTQSRFLGSLGINFRLEKLIAASATEKQQEALQLGYWVLVGDGIPPWLEDADFEGRVPTGMGARYKVIAIVQSKLEVPVGFH